jgi:hypothetical protein
MPWTEEERVRYGAEIADGASRERLHAIVDAWVADHPGTDPAELMQWMQSVIEHNPLLLFDDADTEWLIETLYQGLDGMTHDIAIAAFSGLGAGP